MVVLQKYYAVKMFFLIELNEIERQITGNFFKNLI